MNPPNEPGLVSFPLTEAHTKKATAANKPPLAQEFCSVFANGFASAPSTALGERFGISPGEISPAEEHYARFWFWLVRRLRAFPKAKENEMEEEDVQVS